MTLVVALITIIAGAASGYLAAAIRLRFDRETRWTQVELPIYSAMLDASGAYMRHLEQTPRQVTGTDWEGRRVELLQARREAMSRAEVVATRETRWWLLLFDAELGVYEDKLKSISSDPEPRRTVGGQKAKADARERLMRARGRLLEKLMDERKGRRRPPFRPEMPLERLSDNP